MWLGQSPLARQAAEQYPKLGASGGQKHALLAQLRS
jgi:hypothetical protein